MNARSRPPTGHVYTQKVFVKAFDKGNCEATITFVQALLAECPNSRITLIWDGASYHCSHVVKDYLAEVNQGLQESEWKITCIRFAPNDPQQNLAEDVWLQAKRFILY